MVEASSNTNYSPQLQKTLAKAKKHGITPQLQKQMVNHIQNKKYLEH